MRLTETGQHRSGANALKVYFCSNSHLAARYC